MKKLYLLLVIFFSNYFFLFAQDIECGTMGLLEKQISEDSTLINNMILMELKVQQRIIELRNNNTNQASRAVDNNQVIVIPVVVHVVYNTTAENIPDAQIYSQIRILNEDFRKLNADAINVRSIFQPIAADVKIEFKLEAITRTYTSKSSFNPDDNDIKDSNDGGKDAWDTDYYLNIWVGDIGAYNGYAQFPWRGRDKNDGIVISYEVIGYGVRDGRDKGRTATHEIGHWLGLYHTFQDHCKGTTASNCDNKGDKICDTPPIALPSDGCPAEQNTCSESYGGNKVDQTENFMDYTDDACRIMFSSGQKERMRAYLFTSREEVADRCPPYEITIPESFNFPYSLFGSIVIGSKAMPFTVRAMNNITAQNTIFNDGDVTYQAGVSITLQPGFKAVAGSDFRAFIEIPVCDISRQTANPEEQNVISDTHSSSFISSILTNYPNPVKNQTTIEFSIPTETKTAEIYILNIHGKLLDKYSINSRNNFINVDCSKYSNGIYIYSLITEKGVIGIQKMVIAK